MKTSYMNVLAIFLALIVTFSFSSINVLAQSEEPVRVIIGFKDTTPTTASEIVSSRGGRVERSFRIATIVSAELTESQIELLKRDPRVTSIDPDVEVFAIDAELDNTWGVKRIGAGNVHATTEGDGIKVAVIDSGIDYNHPELAGNYAGGYDFVNDDENPMDDNGHGTHVAGTIAAIKNTSGVVGVGPKIKLYGLKVLNKNGSGSMSDIIAALDWAVDNGVQITNLSLGTTQNPGVAVEMAFANVSASGIVNVAAAGNSGNCGGSGSNVNYPAKYSSVIAVSATSQSDVRPCFSSTGSEVEIAAPGVIIKSTKLGGGYVELSGTSMASPHVAGTAALLISAGIIDSNGNGKVNDEVRKILTDTADDLGSNGRDSLYGYGLVNAVRAMSQIVPISDPIPPSAPESIMKISSVVYSTSGGRNNNKNLNIAIKVVDSSTLPVSGASVSVTIRRDSSTWSGTGATGPSGVVTFSLSSARSGCYTTSIKSITKADFTWDGVNPDQGYCKN